MIKVFHVNTDMEAIRRYYPKAVVINITSRANTPHGRALSPFYPHCGIPIPGESNGAYGASVEGIWQGLKVFEREGISMEHIRNVSMRALKRSSIGHGRVLGHQYGTKSHILLDYESAKELIYYPTYKWVLDNVPIVKESIQLLREQLKRSDVILLDYNINPDCANPNKPISHAELVKMYIEGRYPEVRELKNGLITSSDLLSACRQAGEKAVHSNNRITTSDSKLNNNPQTKSNSHKR